MGDTLDKNTSMKNKETLQEDIKTANKITENHLFHQKTGFNVTFYFHGVENIIGYVMSETNRLNKTEENIETLNKIIGSIIKIIKARFVLKRIRLNYCQFYNFFNTLSDSLSLFYEEKYRINKEINYKTEQELCCICEEKISNVMLSCYHLFCENCIETWLIKKQSNCPLCRVDIKLFQDKHEKNGNSDYCWNLIDINYNDYLKERNAVFQASLDSILKLEEYPWNS